MGDVAEGLLGAGAVDRNIEASMAGEDFAFIAKAVPSAFAFLGMRNESAGSTYGLHTAQYTMDESALAVGAALHAAVATKYLQQYHDKHGAEAGKDEL